MEKGIHHIINKFHDHARMQTLHLYEHFQDAVKKLNRRKDENVYRQTQGKFLFLLRDRLQEEASNLMEDAQAKQNRSGLSLNLSHIIDYYLLDFSQSTSSSS